MGSGGISSKGIHDRNGRELKKEMNTQGEMYYPKLNRRLDNILSKSKINLATVTKLRQDVNLELAKLKDLPDRERVIRRHELQYILDELGRE